MAFTEEDIRRIVREEMESILNSTDEKTTRSPVYCDGMTHLEKTLVNVIKSVSREEAKGIVNEWEDSIRG